MNFTSLSTLMLNNQNFFNDLKQYTMNMILDVMNSE